MRCPCILAAIAATLAASTTCLAQPAGFIEEPVISGLNEPVALVFRPGGNDRMFAIERRGVIWTINRSSKTLLADMRDEVNIFWTRGMTGIAVDPEYATNGYLYVMYTVDWEYYSTGGNPNPAQLDTIHDTFGRLTRFTIDDDGTNASIVPGSRWDMLGSDHTNGFAVTFASHTQNTIQFAPDGTMLISAGDGASMLETDVGGPRQSCCSSNTAESDGILSVFERIGAFRAQQVRSHSGKILRIDPATAEGVPSNPFFDVGQPTSPESRVWAMGLRNPYAFAVRPGTGSADPADGEPGVLVIGDVGWDSWERLTISTGPGQNFGWPIYEGFALAGSYASAGVENRAAPNPLFGGSCTQPFYLFTDLLVQDTLNTPSWPNPCDPGQQIDSSLTHMHRRAALAWRNSRVFPTPQSRVPIYVGGAAADVAIDAPQSPVTGPHLGGVATVGGVFYTGNKYPAEYQGTFFFAEAGSDGSPVGWINVARLNDQHDLVEVAEFRETGSLFPTNLAVDPAGYGIYYANHITGGSIRRIVYDCNGNGVGDDDDIFDGTSPDANGDGIPDDCANPADIDGDGTVDVDDLVLVILNWGPCLPPCTGDVDGNGAVDVDDLVAVILSWS